MADWPFVADFHFLRPWWLLSVIPIGGLLWWLHRRDTAQGGWKGLLAPHLLEALMVRSEEGERFRPYQLVVAVLLLGAVAMAGPAWEREATPFSEDTAPLVVAIDLSESMNAIDVPPMRVERAKQKIRDLVALRSSARTGLIAYAGSAHLVLPLTEDPQLFEMFLDALATDLMPVPGKHPAAALELAEQMLAEEPVAGSIVFLTDQIPPDDLSAFEDSSVSPDQETEVMVLGIGTSRGGPIRIGENLYQTDASGAQVVAMLDRESLDRLAASTGAYVTTVTVDDSDVRRLERRVQSHLEAVQRNDESLRFKDYGYWLVWPALVLCALWFRRGWTVRWSAGSRVPRSGAILAAALISWSLSALLWTASPVRAWAPLEDGGVETSGEETGGAEPSRRRAAWFLDLWLTADQQGQWLFERSRYDEAADRFEDPLWKGTAFYYAGDYESSIAWLARVDSYEASFALGNSNARLERYDEAVRAYARALQLRPEAAEAQANLDWVQNLIDEAEEDQDEPPPGGDVHFDPDEIVFDDKGEKGSKGEVQQQAFSDEQLAEMWMRGIQTSSADFLRFRFAVQAAEAEEDGQ